MQSLSHPSMSAVTRGAPSGIDELGAALMKSGLVAFALVDSGNIVAASPALRELLGASTPYRHLDGQSLNSIVSTADRPAVGDFTRSLVRDGNRGEMRCELLHADGSTVPVMLHAAPIDRDDMRQLVLLVTDLSPWVVNDHTGGSARVFQAFDRETGFVAQALLLDRMRIALAAARRYRRRAAVLRVDMEHLERVLHSLSHDAGEEVVAGIAETLRNCVRDCDTIARLGVREFVLLLPEIGHREDAAISAARVVDAISHLFARNAADRRVSATIGVAVFPADGTNATHLMSAAEAAMRLARGTPGGGFAVADATSAELSDMRLLEISQKHLLGIGELDNEHKTLVDQTNQLVRSLQRGAELSTLEYDLRAAMETLRKHFASEARYLETSPYEGAADRKTRNLHFLDELQCILQHVNAQSVALAIRHLHGWLEPHMLDHELAQGARE
jgi:diguanylate cyclase (GGDEF)-like protein